MAAKDYTKSRATAERLIAKFGAPGAIRRLGIVGQTDPYDPSTGTETATFHACTLVVTEYTLREREASSIGATDKRVLVSTEGLAIEPTAADKVVIGMSAAEAEVAGDANVASHEVVRVSPLSPAGTVVMYDVQAVF